MAIMDIHKQCLNSSYTEFELDIAFLTFETFLAIFICSGNILTIVTVWKTTALRTVPNMYVVSLAVADLSVGCLSVPLQMVFFIPSLDVIYMDKTFCLFGHSLFYVLATTSIFSMVVIAMDRAFYIGYPLHYYRLSTVNKAKVIIVCTWITALILGTVPIYYNNWKECEGCSFFKVIPLPYQVYVQVSLVIIVCIITVVCYGFIFKIARSKQSNTRRFESDMKLVKTFLLVFGLFVLCWAPLMTIITIGHVLAIRPEGAIQATIAVSVLNSGMNFLVYVVKNISFRQAIFKLLCRRNNVITVHSSTCE